MVMRACDFLLNLKSVHGNMRLLMNWRIPQFVVLGLVLELAISAVAIAQENTPPSQMAPAAIIIGTWAGSRLQCRKDESGPVRCGTPSPFKIVFRADGTGKCEGEGFPPEFLYQTTASDKMVVTSVDKGRRWEFFDIKVENEYISFQTYVYPEAGNQAGGDYIHYIFDLAREAE